MRNALLGTSNPVFFLSFFRRWSGVCFRVVSPFRIIALLLFFCCCCFFSIFGLFVFYSCWEIVSTRVLMCRDIEILSKYRYIVQIDRGLPSIPWHLRIVCWLILNRKVSTYLRVCIIRALVSTIEIVSFLFVSNRYRCRTAINSMKLDYRFPLYSHHYYLQLFIFGDVSSRIIPGTTYLWEKLIPLSLQVVCRG